MQKPLRILYHHRTAASDGMRVHIDEVIKALRDRGNLVEVVGPAANGAGGKSKLEGLADFLRRLLPASIFELLELAYNISAYRQLKHAVQTFKPDILYERYNLYLLAGLRLKRRHGLPMILEVNSPLAEERAAFGNLRLRALAERCETALWRGADAVLPVTQVLADIVAKKRKTDAGIQVVPNGALLETAATGADIEELRAQFGLKPGNVVMGFVGFVRAWHGVGWALDALPSLPANTHLLIVGDGPGLPALETRAAELGITDRVHFAGRVPHRLIPAHIELFDIALQTAAVAYASPLKLFEYMAHGRAIIAPDQPNIREILDDGVNALLFAAEDESSFQAALTRLCTDQALRQKIGRQARLTVEERPLTWANNAARIECLGKALLAARSAVVSPEVSAPIAASDR
jgi:glycosyltransferase involved in cell wall biosynthesis